MTNAEAPFCIGVDFGTANSKAAIARVDGGRDIALSSARALRLGELDGWPHSFFSPTSLYLDGSHIHFGAAAHTRYQPGARQMLRSFKMVLGAGDFEAALALYPAAGIDPDSVFRFRDLLTLYLARLLLLVRQSVAATTREAWSLRFCRPGWLAQNIGAAHELMSSLFTRAHEVANYIEGDFDPNRGLPYQTALEALRRASQSPNGFNALNGGIYEASAVAICFFAEARSPDCIVVVDIGAGTSDIAALIRAPLTGEVSVAPQARRTVDVAGDQFDAPLLNVLQAKSKLATLAERGAFWRSLTPRVRQLKEDLFSDGTIDVAFGTRRLHCSAREVEADPQFRAALARLSKLYDECLEGAATACRQNGIRSLGVATTGGGSRLPAFQAIVRRRRRIGSIEVEFLATSPRWLASSVNGDQLGEVFVQLCPAFGAALSACEGLAGQSPMQASRVG